MDNILIIECHKLLTALWKASCSLIPFFFQEWSSWHTASWIFSRRERWFLHQGQHFFTFRFSIRSVNPQGGKKLKEVVFLPKPMCLAESRMYFLFIPLFFFLLDPQNVQKSILSKDWLTIFSNFYIFKSYILGLLHRVANMASSKHEWSLCQLCGTGQFPK